MSRDLKTVATAELQAEYDAALEKIRDLRASIEPLNAELSLRANARAVVLNAVMAGTGRSLVAAGVAKATIDEAERYVAELRAAKRARREELEVSP